MSISRSLQLFRGRRSLKSKRVMVSTDIPGFAKQNPLPIPQDTENIDSFIDGVVAVYEATIGCKVELCEHADRITRDATIIEIALEVQNPENSEVVAIQPMFFDVTEWSKNQKSIEEDQERTLNSYQNHYDYNMSGKRYTANNSDVRNRRRGPDGRRGMVR